MARGTTLKTICPSCGADAHEKERYRIGHDTFIDLKCGHTIIGDAMTPDEAEWQRYLTEWKGKGFEPFPFQIEGVKFLEEADCNALLLDEQGLGKMIQTCFLLARNKDKLLPALIVCKSGLRAQWFSHLVKLTNLIPQVITSSKEVPHFDLFDIVIVSVDSLRLLRPDVKTISDWDIAIAETQGKELKRKKVVWTDEICSKFNFIAIDESQKIKNPGSARTQALRLVASAGMKVKGQKPRIIPMSGTNVEKHAGEFFPTLNLVRPELFPEQRKFIMQHCEVFDGRVAGLKNPQNFKELTKDFIIRRKRVDVMPQLPRIFRQFRLAELEGGDIEAYVRVMKEFMKDAADCSPGELPSNLLGYLSKLRHITGIAKVNAALEFIEEFMLETEVDRKLAVFLHHQQAGAILLSKLTELCKIGNYNPPLYYHAGLNALTERPAMEARFKEPGNKIMLLSTQAAAEGLNLQFCSDCLLMERQWNPGTEEQAEGRFPRPGSTASKINAHYLIAAGTIDDFLTEIVERKRRNVAQTLDGEEMVWDEKNLMAELGRALLTKGIKKWGGLAA